MHMQLKTIYGDVDNYADIEIPAVPKKLFNADDAAGEKKLAKPRQLFDAVADTVDVVDDAIHVVDDTVNIVDDTNIVVDTKSNIVVNSKDMKLYMRERRRRKKEEFKNKPKEEQLKLVAEQRLKWKVQKRKERKREKDKEIQKKKRLQYPSNTVAIITSNPGYFQPLAGCTRIKKQKKLPDHYRGKYWHNTSDSKRTRRLGNY